jgi:hypothetical protein
LIPVFLKRNTLAAEANKTATWRGEEMVACFRLVVLLIDTLLEQGIELEFCVSRRGYTNGSRWAEEADCGGEGDSEAIF